MSEEKRKVAASDIISGKTVEPQEQEQPTEDGKIPSGVHPIVQERLARERATGFGGGSEIPPVENVIPGPAPEPSGNYVTKEQMQNFVQDLNSQLNEIGKWLSIVVEDNKTFKNTFMTVQNNISALQSKINHINRNM